MQQTGMELMGGLKKKGILSQHLHLKIFDQNLVAFYKNSLQSHV